MHCSLSIVGNRNRNLRIAYCRFFKGKRSSWIPSAIQHFRKHKFWCDLWVREKFEEKSSKNTLLTYTFQKHHTFHSYYVSISHNKYISVSYFFLSWNISRNAKETEQINKNINKTTSGKEGRICLTKTKFFWTFYYCFEKSE